MQQKKWDRLLNWSLPVVFIWILIRNKECAKAAYASMQMAATTVIPTLFPFSVLSGYMVRSGMLQRDNLITRTLSRILGIEPGGVSAYLMGSLCGFPVGASVLAELYRSRIVSRSCAERMLAYCNNAGPAFLVAVAGTVMLHSTLAGWLLLLIQIISALFIAQIFRQDSLAEETRTDLSGSSKSTAFTESVQHASLTMLHITGFIVLFSVLLCLLKPFLPANGIISSMIRGILELTNGLYAVSTQNIPIRLKFICMAGLLGWSGFCVHLQVLSQTASLGFSVKKYILGKMLQCLVSLLLAIPLSAFLTDTVPTAVISEYRMILPKLSFFGGLFTFGILIYTFLLWKFRMRSGIIEKNRRRKPWSAV